MAAVVGVIQMTEICLYCQTPIRFSALFEAWVHTSTNMHKCLLPTRIATPSEDNADIDAIIYEGRIL